MKIIFTRYYQTNWSLKWTILRRAHFFQQRTVDGCLSPSNPARQPKAPSLENSLRLVITRSFFQVLLRQEHHDEGPREEVRVQVRLPRSGGSDAARRRGSGRLQVPKRAVHVRLRARQVKPHAATGRLRLGLRSRWPFPICLQLLVHEPGREPVRGPPHGLRPCAASSGHLSALRMTHRRALERPGYATLTTFYSREFNRPPPSRSSAPPSAGVDHTYAFLHSLFLVFVLLRFKNRFICPLCDFFFLFLIIFSSFFF